MKSPVFAFLHDFEDEQIDVVRIRLWNSKNASAVLSDFYNTERVLAEWAQSSDCSVVRFAVCFVDGYVLEGCHAFYSRGKRRCRFCTHLRSLMNGRAEAGDFAHVPRARDATRYMIPAY